MFEKKRRSRGSLIFLAILLTILLGSNAIGYVLARDQIHSSPQPDNLPQEGPLPFGRNFGVIHPTFAVTVPFEIGGFHLTNAYPQELTLRYEDYAKNATMTATISDSRYYFEDKRPIKIPESYLARKGLTGQLVHEIFARGPSSEGISLNPYQAIREGLAARLRGAMNAAAHPASISAVFVSGDDNQGQVWRLYQDKDKQVALLEGTLFDPKHITHISMRFVGPVFNVLPILTTFSSAIEFTEGDAKMNESLADGCLSDELYEVEAPWESGCRQAHLVASLISQKGRLDIARRLYGEYMAGQDETGILALYSELHYEMHLAEGWEKLIEQMKKENPTLLAQEQPSQ